MAEDFRNTITLKFKPENEQSLIKAINSLDKATKSLINSQAKLVKQGRLVKSDSEQNSKAIEKLHIKLLAVGSNFEKAGISAEIYANALRGDKVAMEQLRNAVNRFISDQKKGIVTTNQHSKGLFALGHSARQTGGAFSVLRSKLLLFNFAMTLGIRQLLKFAEEASKLEALETAFNTLSGGGARASEALERLQEATNGTVSSMDLFQQANNAMILGVTKNSDEMAEMFDMAQRLGRALGRDTRSSIESFVTGVGRQSRLMLDNIGLIVKSEVAYKAFASQVGKTTDELDEMEQKQAFLNAALVAGEIALRGIGTETLSSADKLQQMSTELTEVRQRIGDELLPLVLEMTKATKDFIEAIDGDDIRNAIAAIETLTVAFVSFKAIATASQAILALLALSFPQVAIILGLASAIGTLGFQYQQASKQALDLRNAQNNVNTAIKEARKALEDYSDFVSNFEKNRDNAVALIKAEANLRIEKNKEAMQSFIDYLAILKLGQKEFNELLSLESKRAGVRKRLEDEFKNLAISNKNEIINSLVEIEMQKHESLLNEKQRLEREKEFNDIRKRFNDLLLKNTSENNNIAHEERIKLAKETFDKLISSEQEFLEFRKKNINDMADFELEALDKAIKFFSDREDMKKLALGDTTAFRLKELGKIADEFIRLGLNEPEFIQFIEDQKNKILEESAKKRKALGLDSMKDEINNLNKLAGAINALGGAFDVLADSQASATAKMSAFLRMAGGLLSVLGQGTPTGAFGGVLSAIGGAIGHTGGYIKQDGSIQGFAKGGMVLGQDNVPIMAQAGEFIMRKSAVDEIGVNTLAKLNKGETEVGNTVNTININIDGNIVGNEEFVRESLIPEIERTVQKGLA
jgi:type II secretory pathway pseudopilin PulG